MTHDAINKALKNMGKNFLKKIEKKFLTVSGMCPILYLSGAEPT